MKDNPIRFAALVVMLGRAPTDEEMWLYGWMLEDVVPEYNDKAQCTNYPGGLCSRRTLYRARNTLRAKLFTRSN